MKALQKFFPLAARLALIAALSIASALVVNGLRSNPPAWKWSPAPPPAPVMEDIDEFQAALKRPETVLIDARDEFFYEMGHIPGAQNLPTQSADAAALELWRTTLGPEAKIIVYCSDEFCPMAYELSEKMISIGLSPIIFKPGFNAWEAQGLRVETNEPDQIPDWQ